VNTIYVKESSKNHDISVRVPAHFLLSGSGWVLGKTRILVRFVLAGFGLLPISI